MQDILEPRDGPSGQTPDIQPVYGRAGRGVASIVPHLYRQQQINDKPVAPPEDLPAQRVRLRESNRPQ